MVNATIEGNDEIDDYMDMRVVGSCEALWRLLDFSLQIQNPAVQALRVHLEDQQQVLFVDGSELQDLENVKETELTAFFKLNEMLKAENASINQMPKYVDMPKQYTYKRGDRKWNIRKGKNDTVGRVHSVSPATGDLYYLRMLLHQEHCRGKTNYTDLRTINGEVCESYQEVCDKLGLLEGDSE